MGEIGNIMIYMNKLNFIHSLLLTILAIVGQILTPSFARAEAAAHVHEEKQPAVSATAAIGGDFTLTDQNGKLVKDAEFRGKLMLVFFGFTHCPEICPTTVSTLSKVMTALGDKADKVAPVFISVDPKRDTPKVMKEYLANFDKRIVGLTGTPQEVKKAADAYKIYFAINKDSKTGEDDYQVDHSTIVYMMDKNGQYVRHFSYNAGEQEITKAILEALK
jgi:protein SCO1/2